MKRKSEKSPQARSLEYLRDLGYRADNSERFVAFPKPGHKVDLFGFVDIVAVGAGRTVGVQTTTLAHMKERIEKIRECDSFPWIKTAWIVEVHGWEKLRFEDGVVRWRLNIYDMESGRERYGNGGWRRTPKGGTRKRDRGASRAERNPEQAE